MDSPYLSWLAFSRKNPLFSKRIGIAQPSVIIFFLTETLDNLTIFDLSVLAIINVDLFSLVTGLDSTSDY
jgi:hypothetical protein